ncbi:dynamin family protein [Cellulomonas endometrii]|uniref:dynamin family protein n=1 Tax=Cellulomonas endometrii TaxID=3036301 RepID=UPI0024AD54BC|nr:dynamin family protein [Cellulomonas endometrii]
MVDPLDTAPAAPGAGGDAALVDALERLHARLRDVSLPLEVPGAVDARADRRAALDQLDDYLLPRLRAGSAPLLVVVGGSTGAGKSTLVNSLLGTRVTDPGVLRPTTRAPVLVHHPLDGRWFSSDRVLPGLPRVTGTSGTAAHGTATSATAERAAGTDRGAATERSAADRAPVASTAAVRLVASDALPRGLALLDAPDIDSVEEANRALATQLLAAADLWLFVTTAARYADAVPWDLLHGAAERHAQIALVVDRVDPGAEAAVADLRRMMDANGLADAPLFAVEEGLDADGLLPERAVGAVASWLSDLGGDAAARHAVAVSTRDGVVQDLGRRALLLATAADAQVTADARLRDAVARAYADALTQVAAATSDGAMLRGEVLARWQEFVGTGELIRSVEQGVGRVRDAVVGFVRGRPAPVPPVEQAIAHGLAAVVLDAADGAAERTHAAWRGDPAGAALLPDLDLSRSSASLRAEVDQQIHAWQTDVLELVREQGAERRGTARALSFGVNALGVSLMVLAFASTGGLTGVEIGIAGGTAVVAQKLLEAVFGDDAVRRLTTAARERLDTRVRQVLAGEAARYTAQLDALGVGGGEALRATALTVQDAARAERAGRVTGLGPEGEQVPAGARSLSGARALRGADAWRAGGGGGDVRERRDGEQEGRAPSRPGFWQRLLGRGDQG